MLEKAFEEQSIVTGNMTGPVKGGFTVAIEGVRAFLPGSLVDVRPISDMAYLENKELEFKVIKLDQVRNNVVVSRRAVVEKEMEAERKQLLENIEEGQIIRGVVKNLTDYGAFVNLGGLDGLLHITDISWKRVKHPSEVVNVGDEVDVRVLKFDRERNRVSLGMKQLGDDPWTDISRRYPERSRLFGKVTNVTDYGAFVDLGGIDGLLHITDISWSRINHPSEAIKIGEELDVKVIKYDKEEQKVSLGIKQLVEDPWVGIESKFPLNTSVMGTVTNLTDYGFFAEIDDITAEGLVLPCNFFEHNLFDARFRGNDFFPNSNANHFEDGFNQVEKFIEKHNSVTTVEGDVKEGLLNISNTVETMAEAEGLQAHKNAISIRVKDLNN